MAPDLIIRKILKKRVCARRLSAKQVHVLSANGNFISISRAGAEKHRLCANTARQAERPAYENSSQLTKQPGVGRRAIEPARERANHGAAANQG